MKKTGGLRKRWLINTVGVVFALGLVCVFAVTALFANYYYSNMLSDMNGRAERTADFFTGYIDQDYNRFYQSCITYAQTFEDKDTVELQFINNQWQIVASSYGHWAGESPVTPEIHEAVSVGAPRPYLGKNPTTGERIMAVSCPMIYSNGEVIGVLRYVTSTKLVDQEIVLVAIVCFLVLLVVLTVVLLSSGYYIRSILVPVAEITEKAKRIAGGTCGIQIQTVGQVGVAAVNVDVVKQIGVHEVTIALVVCACKSLVLVKVYGFYFFKADLAIVVFLD